MSHSPGLQVITAGLQTTVQDVAGRLGYWMVGVPPSGAMDALSLRLANRIVGNHPHAAGVECTAIGPSLRIGGPCVVALAGADTSAAVDGRPVPFWEPIPLQGGEVLDIGRVLGSGMRSYLAVRGGIDVPEVLGSRATFTLGGFGGLHGRELQPGDHLAIGADDDPDRTPHALRPAARPMISSAWTIGVTEGPHADTEFFAPGAIDELLAAAWTVQQHAARTGVRLSGPTPRWAREDGGEAGLHPSNIHDTGYAFAAVDFTGDTPVILGPDGPSLGGFTCPFTVVLSERWKLGQLAPGDTVQFQRLDVGSLGPERARQHRTVDHLREPEGRQALRGSPVGDGGVIERITRADGPDVTFRRAGDDFLLVEVGPMRLDLELRALVHAFAGAVDAEKIDGLVDVTAGIRSLLVHIDPDVVDPGDLVQRLAAMAEQLGDPLDLEIPSRVVHLPLSWEDPSTLEAIQRYMSVVRDDAPWCPSNIEFIRRVNGLDTVDDVRRVVFDASYLVLGLGDVYLGAPVATPLDPRHRLVTTKYNPARTWTPQNAVGIGGAYLCVYGMEGPGGYQFVGRTVPVWYLDTETPGPDPHTPWLLRVFDQIRFHPVTTDQLTELRGRATAGELTVDIQHEMFSLRDHRMMLDAEADDIAAFRERQRAAFDAERERWRLSGELS
ncbi:MAG: 5-oxoprolinase/urea amidolyase family protein [Actinomycetota bacterium]